MHTNRRTLKQKKIIFTAVRHTLKEKKIIFTAVRHTLKEKFVHCTLEL